MADAKAKFRIASENPAKFAVVQKLIEQHRDDNILIIGQYINQLQLLAGQFDAPIITGKTSNKDRERIYGDFRTGVLKRLIVSKVANFAIDLPDANGALLARARRKLSAWDEFFGRNLKATLLTSIRWSRRIPKTRNLQPIVNCS